MPRYASFNFIEDPAPVTGWYDTTKRSYPSLPDLRNLLELTDDEWAASRQNPSGWAVANGTHIVAYTPSVPVAEQAQMLLAAALDAGIAITSGSLPSVNATYALDSISTAQIFQIGTFANSFGLFPNGTSQQMYPDISGIPHTFTIPVFVSFLQAVAALVSNLQAQTAIMTNGGIPSWPSQSASIV